MEILTTVTGRVTYQYATIPVAVEKPTIRIECDCKCSWSVIRPGVGIACISRLTRRSGICPHRHEPERGDDDA